MKFRPQLFTLLLALGPLVSSQGATNSPALSRTNAPTMEIGTFDIQGNTVLPPEQFRFLTNYTGHAVTFSRLREGLVQLQLRYHELGYPTISVTLPPQKITNGVVHVKVVEGHLTSIKVTGNHYYSTANVLHSLPSLDTNVLLNTKWFQPELNQANANRDRQIYPVIGPGPDPGTTELTLKVKDRLPLHGRQEINDKSSPATPLLRSDTAVQYDNLWQRNQQVGLDYNFSPQAYKHDPHNFYDQPMVASYSGYYRIPLGTGHGLREDYEQKPVTFGFDETSRKFNLPSPTGQPDVIFYASRSVSDTPVRYGPLSVIFTNTLVNLDSQSASRSLTINNNLGSKITVPVREFAGIFSSFNAGVDYKSYTAPSFSTNLSYFTQNTYDNFGNLTNYGSDVIALPGNSFADLHYIPFSFGWSGSRPDAQGGFNFYFNQSVFLDGLASARTNFENVAGAAGAGGNYTTVNLGLSREQRLPGEWSAGLNLNGQWASAPLISNEQIALGGAGGIRGYQQGEIYGDNGWRALLDLRAPPVNVGYFPTANGDVPAQLHTSVFMDYGQVYLIDHPSTGNLAYTEWGTGAGLFLTAGEHFDARLTLAWALHDTLSTHVGEARAYFSIGYQF